MNNDDWNSQPWYKKLFRWSAPNVKYIIAAIVVVFGLALCSESRAAAISVGGGLTKYKADVESIAACTNNFKWCATINHFGAEDRDSKFNKEVNSISVYRKAHFRSNHSLRPYVSIGASYADRSTMTQATKYNFRLGVGFLYVNDDWFADLGAIHESNASLKRPNSGRDAVILQIGKRF